MKIISREDARKAGLKRFFTGVECRHGHVCERYVCDGVCVECERLRRQRPGHLERALRAEQRAEDDRLREAARAVGETRYWSIRLCGCEDHNEDGRCLRRARERSRYPSCVRCENIAQARRDRSEKGRERDRLRSQTEARRKYVNLYMAKRRSRIRATLAGAGPEEIARIDALYDAADVLRRVCGLDVEVDHTFPLSKGGPHREWNLEIMFVKENRGVGGKHDRLDYALERFDSLSTLRAGLVRLVSKRTMVLATTPDGVTTRHAPLQIARLCTDPRPPISSENLTSTSRGFPCGSDFTPRQG